ncbi:MAG: hypothetical protein IPH48_06160 [bacterium]|nr:hypothetical protein [bacterium]
MNHPHGTGDRKLRRLAWLATALLGLVTAPATAGAQPGASPDSSAEAGAESLILVLADWRVEALGRQAAGRAAWVTGPAGDLRVDLLVDEAGADPGAGAPADLLTRAGRGWTLVAGQGDEGLYGAWDREWRTPPSGLAALARAVTDPAWSTAAGGGSRRLVLAADPAATPEAAGAPVPAFRRAQARRGRGGGGPGERLTVSSLGTPGALRVRSSRRPGRLEVVPTARRAALGVPAEVFLPWWPLAEVLDPGTAATREPNPGTSGSGPR